MTKKGGALTSYLLFERSYTGALIDLGRQDTLARRDEVLEFCKALRRKYLVIRQQCRYRVWRQGDPLLNWQPT